MRSAGVRGPSLRLWLARGWDFGVRVGLHILMSGGFYLAALANCRSGVACDPAGGKILRQFSRPPEAPLGEDVGVETVSTMSPTLGTTGGERGRIPSTAVQWLSCSSESA